MTSGNSAISFNDRHLLVVKSGQSAKDLLGKQQTNNPEIDSHQEEPEKPNKNESPIILGRPGSEQEEPTMPDEEKYFGKYLDSRLSNIETTMKTAIEHQTKELGIIAGNLKENVDRSLVQSDIARKGLASNNKWLITSMFTVVIMFAGLLYFMMSNNTISSNINNNIIKDNLELRKEFYQSQMNLSGSLSKDIMELGKGLSQSQIQAMQQAVKELQKTQPEKQQKLDNNKLPNLPIQ